jgi:phosphate/sulfate permease
MPLAAGHEENAMRFGPSISASILHGLGWILLGLAALMAALAILAFAGLVTLPISIRTDLIGATACAGLGFLSRLLARRFERAASPG